MRTASSTASCFSISGGINVVRHIYLQGDTNGFVAFWKKQERSH